MQSLKNKIILITGASSGIGEACADEFAKLGANLILTARRFDRIYALAAQLADEYKINALPLEIDVKNKDSIQTAFSSLSSQWKAIDILINNAGIMIGSDKIQDGDIDSWDAVIDTNLKGLLYMTRSVLPGMLSRNQGHIVNIGSVAGRECYSRGNIYSATKHAVRAISQSLRIDLLGTAIRVSEIQPGIVETEFSEQKWNNKEKAKEFYGNLNPLVATDIADAVIWSVTRPPHVNIAEILIHPQDQPTANHLINRKGEKIGIL